MTFKRDVVASRSRGAVSAGKHYFLHFMRKSALLDRVDRKLTHVVGRQFPNLNKHIQTSDTQVCHKGIVNMNLCSHAILFHEGLARKVKLQRVIYSLNTLLLQCDQFCIIRMEWHVCSNVVEY
jgi:hypothetical protein